ncbi:MAG: hypothetical protein AAF570_11585, partial [Bacteroidota bacterium]
MAGHAATLQAKPQAKGPGVARSYLARRLSLLHPTGTRQVRWRWHRTFRCLDDCPGGGLFDHPPPIHLIGEEGLMDHPGLFRC